MSVKQINSRSLCGLLLGLCLTVSSLAGPLCVSTYAQDEPTDPREAEEKAKKAAEDAIGTVMKLNKQVGMALSVVRGIATSDPFAIINVLVELMLSDGQVPDITVRQARDEIIAEMRKEREEVLTNRVETLVEWFGELIANPENMTFEGRLEDYLNEALSLTVDLRAIMENTDPLRAEMAYHLVAAYNTAVSSRVIGLSTARYSQGSIDNVVGDAIDTNGGLVSDNDQWGGYLYNFVQKQAGPYTCGVTYIHAHTSMPTDGAVQYEMDLEKGGWVRTAGPFEIDGPHRLQCADEAAVQRMVNLRFDADPIVYMVRQSIVEQQLSLLPQ